MRRLVATGVDVNGQSPLGQTPLHIAAGHGQVDVVKTLLELRHAQRGLGPITSARVGQPWVRVSSNPWLFVKVLLF